MLDARAFLDDAARARAYDALACPAAARGVETEQTLRLVEFLEDTIIRAWPIERRNLLRDARRGVGSARDALNAYGESLDPPLRALGDANGAAVADETLSRALGLRFRDAREREDEGVRTLERSSKRLRLSAKAGGGDAASALVSASGRAALGRLARALGCDDGGSQDGDALDACVTLERCVAAQERFVTAFDSEAGRDAARHPPRLEDVPSGVGLNGDAEVERAVAVARLLHVNDLRRLQSDVDAFLVSMQEYTADPKTDSRMGRVGR